MARQTVDWIKAKAVYAASNKSFDEIAKEFGTTASAVGKRAQREKWTDARHVMSQKVEARVTDNAADELAASIEKMNSRHLKIAESLGSGMSLIVQASITRDAQGKVSGTSLSPKDIKSLSSAHLDLQRAERLARGLSTDNSSINASIKPADPSAKTGMAALYEAMVEAGISPNNNNA